MGESSKISWTDATFNPWHGCVEVSPGCQGCYARDFSKRIGHGKRLPMIWGVDADRKPMSEAYWRAPLKWNRDAARDGVRRRVFCASMADVFELLPARNTRACEVVSRGRERLWPLIESTPWLDWLLLTKRPENIRVLAPWQSVRSRADESPWPANVWVGTTAEDQRRANERIPILLDTPAAIRFVSYEPALERVDFRPFLATTRGAGAGIDWLIIGGESGHDARQFNIDWARQALRQTKGTSCRPFVKQLGSNPWIGSVPLRPKDGKGGDPAEWPADIRERWWPESKAST